MCKEIVLNFDFFVDFRMNMYPWYRDSVGGQLGQLCGPMATTIKTENGYNDCMLALDYATQSKVGHFRNLICFILNFWKKSDTIKSR